MYRFALMIVLGLTAVTARASTPQRPVNYFPTPPEAQVSDGTVALAEELAEQYEPGVLELSLLRTGWFRHGPERDRWARNAVFAISTPQGVQKIIKLAALPATEEERAATAAEAHRAHWAGQLDPPVAPKVQAIDETHGAYLADYFPGEVLFVPPGEGLSEKFLTAVMQAVATLHRAHIPEELAAGPANWLDNVNNTALDTSLELLAMVGPAPWDDPHYVREMVLLRHQLAAALQALPYSPVPIHGDLQLRKVLAVQTDPQGYDVRLTDWFHLKNGDPMVDLAHFACFADISVANLDALLQPYWAAQGDANASHQDAERMRLQLLLAQAHLIRHVFAAAHERMGPSDYAGWRLQQDRKALAPLFEPALPN